MLKIRFSRAGRKKQPFFKIVVISKDAPPSGGNSRDQVGTYDPKTKQVTLDAEKIRAWMAKGAQPSDSVYNLLVKHRIIFGKKIKVHDKDPEEPKIEEDTKLEKTTEKVEETSEPKEETPEAEEKKEEVKEDKPQVEEEKPEEADVKEVEKKEEPKAKEEEKTETEEVKEEKSFEDIGLTGKIVTSLEEAGIKSVADLKEKTDEDLKEIKGLGEKSIEKIKEELK